MGSVRRCRQCLPWQPLYVIVAVLTASAWVSGVASLQFTQEPGNHVAVEAQPTWWHCAAHSDLPITYTWSQDDRPVNGRPNSEVLSNGTLHIISVSQSDVGSYTCQARTSSGEIVTSREALLSIASLGSSFSTSPQSQSQNLASSASLHCTIASNPQAAVSWLFNGGGLVAGATVTTTTVDATTRSTLTTGSLDHSHGGLYRCRATNTLLPDLVVYSETATLTLIGRPGFVLTPSPQTVAVGGTATMTCQTTGSPSASVQWLDPDNNVIQNSGRFSSTSTTLRIRNLQIADTGFYTCQATNEWGDNMASALLTVAEAIQQVIFTATPSDKSVAVGQRVTWSCEATGSPDPAITWSKQGGALPSDRVEEPAPGWLRLTGVLATDSGVYVCTASNGVTSVSSQAQLIVQVPPSFTAAPVDTTALVGESAFFQCRSEGSPAPTVVWTTPTTGPLQAPSGRHGGVEVDGDGTLAVSPIQRQHAGTYTCTATNSVTVISRNAVLDVQSAPVFTTRPTDQRVIEGSSAQLACRAGANPPPRIAWFFNGALVVNDPKHSVYGNGDLTLSNLQKAQEGTYTCRAVNSLGMEEASAFIVVLVPPDFAARPTDLTIELGDSVRLDCIGTGDPMPVLQWLKDDQPLVLESNVEVLGNFSLSLTSITTANLGTYTCRATSEAGMNQISANVWPPDIPFFTVPPTNVTANESAPTTLPCQASARRPPVIRWYLADAAGTRGAEIGLGTNPSGSRGAVSFVGADGSLVFNDIRREDEGLYMCVANNGIGSVETVTMILVNVPPEIPTITSPVVIVETAAFLLLQCVATGRPRPSLAWFLPSGQPVPDDPSRYNAQSPDGYLVVYGPSVAAHDGDFLCVAQNFLGNASALITVVVQGTPILTRILATVDEGGVTLQCLTRGSPSPVNLWTRNGLDVNAGLPGHFVRSDGALVITDPALAEAGTYECTAANTHGDASATFRVPDIPGAPQVVAIKATSIDLAWSPPTPNSNLTFAGYQLQYMPFSDAQYRDHSGQIAEPYTSVTGLVPYSGYVFRVRAVNELGPGAYSLVTPFVLTAEAGPSEPRDLFVTPSGDLLVVTWSEPADLNGHPDNIVYQIGYVLEDGEPDQEMVLSHSHDDLPFQTILSVRRNAVYRVRIRAGNTLLGAWSDYVSMDVMTLVEAPVKTVTGLKAIALGSNAVSVQWQPVEDVAFEHYDITFRQLDSNMSYEMVRVTEITATNFTIRGLRESTDYAVKMSYSNAGGQGPYTGETLVTTELEPLSPRGYGQQGLSSGILAAVICAAVAVLLLVLVLAAIAWQRRHDSGGWIGRKRLNPDALWIHKRYSYGDDYSLDSYPDDSSGNSGQKGTYDVAIVNENYQGDDTVISTDSAYDLGSGGDGHHDDEEPKKKKKRKWPKGWSDVIYKSPKNPGVVLVKKAVIGDSDFGPSPVPLANQTLDEDQTYYELDAPPKGGTAENRGEDEKEGNLPSERRPQDPDISSISAGFPISTEFPEFLSSTAEFPAHDAEFLGAGAATATTAADFPVFPNADDSLTLAAQLNVDDKQMRKMARKTAREQRRRDRRDRKELEGTRSGRRKLSDRIAGKLIPRRRGSMNLYGDGPGVVERDYPTMTERQKENAAMF